MTQRLSDVIEVRTLLENWVLWRDAGNWEQFAGLWHPKGVMVATWYSGPATTFIENSKAAFARGLNVSHSLGGITIEFEGHRALAQSKMSITQRLPVHGILVDVTCTGRFYDFIDNCDGRWQLLRRQCIYENDRMTLVTPGSAPALDLEKLMALPEGYRHLAYVQQEAGMTVDLNKPGRSGPALDALYSDGEHWLSQGIIN